MRLVSVGSLPAGRGKVAQDGRPRRSCSLAYVCADDLAIICFEIAPHIPASFSYLKCRFLLVDPET